MIVHLSIDDVGVTLADTKNSNGLFYKNKFFRYLYRLYQKYDCKLSLYIQNWGALEENCFEGMAQYSDWLKFGIHTARDGRDFSNLSYKEGKSEWQDFCRMVIGGGVEAVIALMFFQGFIDLAETMNV